MSITKILLIIVFFILLISTTVIAFYALIGLGLTAIWASKDLGIVGKIGFITLAAMIIYGVFVGVRAFIRYVSSAE